MRRALAFLVVAAAGCGGVPPENASTVAGATPVAAPPDANGSAHKERFPEIPLPDGRSAFTVPLDPDILMGSGPILPGCRVDVVAVLSHGPDSHVPGRCEWLALNVLVLDCDWSRQEWRWYATLALTPDECTKVAESAKAHPIWLLLQTPLDLKR